MNYEVLIVRRAQKELADLPPRDYDRVKASISALGNSPRHRGCLKLTSRPGWRIRVGNYRVLYEIDDLKHTVTILHVGNRRDVYKSGK
jgi:mRNA interferase RelE/StbE